MACQPRASVTVAVTSVAASVRYTNQSIALQHAHFVAWSIGEPPDCCTSCRQQHATCTHARLPELQGLQTYAAESITLAWPCAQETVPRITTTQDNSSYVEP